MNKLIMIFAASALLLTFSLSSLAQSGTLYGKKFKTKDAIAASDLASKMGDKTNLDNVVVMGEITEVCQTMGCWIKLKNEGGDDVFIKFKDHSFLIPKDISGRKAYVSGNAVKKTVSVSELRHYAEDAGKSDEEIEKITEPKTEVRVVATGVIIE